MLINKLNSAPHRIHHARFLTLPLFGILNLDTMAEYVGIFILAGISNIPRDPTHAANFNTQLRRRTDGRLYPFLWDKHAFDRCLEVAVILRGLNHGVERGEILGEIRVGHLDAIRINVTLARIVVIVEVESIYLSATGALGERVVEPIN